MLRNEEAVAELLALLQRVRPVKFELVLGPQLDAANYWATVDW